MIPKLAIIKPSAELIPNLLELEKKLFYIYMLEYSDKLSTYQWQKIKLNTM